MPSICLCTTEVSALYGLRLPAPEVGGARSLHATQLGATGGVAHPIGAFSTAGARRLREFLHYSSSHNRTKHDCGLFTDKSRIKLFLWPPCVADADILFCSCGFFFLSSSPFFPRLFAVVADWMSIILPHMMWS